MKRGLVVGGGAVIAAATMLVDLLNIPLPSPSILVGNTEPSPKPTTSEPAGAKVYTGDAIDTRYGTVQVQITVENAKITDVQVLQAPTGPNSQYTDYAVPVLTQQALKAQSAEIAGASGASYTSGGFIQSLQSAISQM